MRISRLIMLFASAMLLANVPTQTVRAGDLDDSDVPHLTTDFEILVGTVIPATNDLQRVHADDNLTLQAVTSNRKVEVEFETNTPPDAVVFSLNLQFAGAISTSGLSFATQTAAEDRIKNWATGQFDEITDFENISTNLYAEPGTGKVLLRVSRSYAAEAKVAIDAVTWVSSFQQGLGDATSESLVLAPNGGDVVEIYGPNNSRIQTILPGIDLTCIPRTGRGILIAPDVLWGAWHVNGVRRDVDSDDSINREYTFVDNLGNVHNARVFGDTPTDRALSISQKLGGDGVLVKLQWVDANGATIPPPPEIQPALVPPADFACFSDNQESLGFRVDHVELNDLNAHPGCSNPDRRSVPDRLTAGRYVFASRDNTPVFKLFEQASDLPAALWDDGSCGDSGGAMFVVLQGRVVAMGATWNAGEEGTAISSYLDELEGFSTGHKYLDLSEFRGFLLGDCNQDGIVNLGDIAAFIAVVTSFGYLAEADCNGDGEVNLFDIAPFITILTSP